MAVPISKAAWVALTKHSDDDCEIEAAAGDAYSELGQIEVDDDAVVSHADPRAGAYVAAWVWVDADDVGHAE